MTLSLRNSSGFSLVEILVALTIFTLVLFIGSSAYGQFSRLWNKEQDHFDNDFEYSKGLRIFLDKLAGIHPYMILEEEQPLFVFEGGNRSLQSVVSSSSKDPDFPALFEIYIETSSDGQKALMYKEAAIVNSPILSPGDVIVSGEANRLFSGFDDVLFEYLGHRNVDNWFAAQEVPNNVEEEWFHLYSSKDTGVVPSAIRVTVIDHFGTSRLVVPLPGILIEQLEFYSNADQ